MKKLLILLVIAISFIACNTSEKVYIGDAYVCNCEQRDKVVDFISKNIKNANNMSKRSMEYVITELRRTGIRLYCKEQLIEFQNGAPIGLDSCEFAHYDFDY